MELELETQIFQEEKAQWEEVLRMLEKVLDLALLAPWPWGCTQLIQLSSETGPWPPAHGSSLTSLLLDLGQHLCRKPVPGSSHSHLH